MPLYQLTMQPAPQSAPETLQFIEGDVPSALTFANQYSSLMPAELWSDGRRVCQLIHDEKTGLWVVADPGEGDRLEIAGRHHGVPDQVNRLGIRLGRSDTN